MKKVLKISFFREILGLTAARKIAKYGSVPGISYHPENVKLKAAQQNVIEGILDFWHSKTGRIRSAENRIAPGIPHEINVSINWL